MPENSLTNKRKGLARCGDAEKLGSLTPLFVAFILAIAGGGLVGCDNSPGDHLEDAGDNVEDAAESAVDSVDDQM